MAVDSSQLSSASRDAYWQATQAELKSAQQRGDILSLVGLGLIAALLWFYREPGENVALWAGGIATVALAIVAFPQMFVARRKRRISAARGMNCQHCVAEAAPSEADLELAGLSAAQVAGWTFRAGLGCGHCRGAGYKGRKAVAEVLVLDDTMREMIVGKASISSLKEHATLLGLRSLHDTAFQWVSRGETTLEEVARVAG